MTLFYLQELWKYFRFCDFFSVIRRVFTQLPDGPSNSGYNVVAFLFVQNVIQNIYALQSWERKLVKHLVRIQMLQF